VPIRRWAAVRRAVPLYPPRPKTTRTRPRRPDSRREAGWLAGSRFIGDRHGSISTDPSLTPGAVGRSTYAPPSLLASRCVCPVCYLSLFFGKCNSLSCHVCLGRALRVRWKCPPRRATPIPHAALQLHRLAGQMAASEARRRTDSNALARNPLARVVEYSSHTPLSEHTMLTHAASPVCAQWFPLILDALMADKFVDFVDAFCECSVPPK